MNPITVLVGGITLIGWLLVFVADPADDWEPLAVASVAGTFLTVLLLVLVG